MRGVIHERSAGGVLLVPVGRQTLVALIELQGGRVLALPKGHIEQGETPEQTARREIQEETGLTGGVIADLGEISYWFYSRQQASRVAKRVKFFLLVYRAGSPAHHNGEVEGVRLVPLHRAAGIVTYQGERDVVRRAQAWLENGGGPVLAPAKVPTSERPMPALS